ncbi:transmembrane protein 272-like [Anarrhichthys ocellatus]|uniref:transmembrane protein 272-like n=1 Tax=Anarrhichthys ocellatus TaxID=433405 RepID=UPI0012ECE0D6|nr:transmembrane protein 272-like [Anarrhichthys ocellatus]XP_031697155.1 transmembrane protein 272-like [Anarrhichthys ocellatus]XP_031697156.1 transmembrane protein 272-like [Anarrhichthys ocellatus]XP_031697161.1 transmembrane protein 272-like [Anarrhichthys ocellatus]XP_031697162.1 transmembrane protein 272-like [Anarrhichthys ocellatus]XP_031697163.1 transmembrane protein 272-like [Anarrhichthys ocellatus]
MLNTGVIQRIRSEPQALACSKLVFCVIPIAQIVIGAIHLDDCPRQHYIPIYLIVVGVFGLVLAALSCQPSASTPEDGTPNPLSRFCMTWNSLTSLFLFCWFIAGEFKQRRADEGAHRREARPKTSASCSNACWPLDVHLCLP